jgi:hypothetical protein
MAPVEEGDNREFFCDAIPPAEDADKGQDSPFLTVVPE